MKHFLAIAAAGVLIASVTPSSMSLAMTDDECKAEFAKWDTDGKGQIEGEATKPFTEVMTKVDVNGDGIISADEYIVACKANVLKDIKKGGA